MGQKFMKSDKSLKHETGKFKLPGFVAACWFHTQAITFLYKFLWILQNSFRENSTSANWFALILHFLSITLKCLFLFSV